MTRELPNILFTDLPTEAAPDAGMIEEAARTLRRNRADYLACLTNHEIISKLSEMAYLWRDPKFHLRQKALESSPEETGFPPKVLADGLDACFDEWTEENFHKLLTSEFGIAARLEELCVAGSGAGQLVAGPELLAHLAPGNLPIPVFRSIAFGCLLRSAQFVKCARKRSLLPRLFVHSLHELDSKLASCIEMAEWTGGDETREKALFAEADCVTVTGRDETTHAVSLRIPTGTRLISHGHKISLGFIAREAWRSTSPSQIIARAADDIVAWNQQGCLSPHSIYVEKDGAVNPESFAEMLAEELETRETDNPRGPISTQESAAIASHRHFFEVRAANLQDTRLWACADSTAWTVVFEEEPRFQASPLNRFIFIKAADDLPTVLNVLEIIREQVSTVGIASTVAGGFELANAFAKLGVPRICPLGRMQKPPLAWHHDGRPALGEWVRWTDWEQE